MPGKPLLLLLLAVAGLFAPASRLVEPREVEPWPACPEGRLRVVNWNVHRFRGPDRQGARAQQHQILEELDEQRADVYLLQEIPPGLEQVTVDTLGMPGYQSLTLPDKSALVLIHPALKVLENRRVWLFPRPEPGDEAEAQAALADYQRYTHQQMERQYFEPRTAQIFVIATPSGQRLKLFHVHLTSGPADYRLEGRPSLAELRLEQARLLFPLLEEGGLPVVGGGDFNGPEVAAEFRARGYEVGGRQLDWLVARGIDQGEVDVAILKDEQNDELRLSDHPLMRAEYLLR